MQTEAAPTHLHAMPEHVDVLIVGAGLSGIGAACHLTRECPDRSFAIVESREAIGGTWDLFRYPGIRSDSDMFTLGYSFKPWREARAIADGRSIRHYIREAAEEHGIADRIHFNSRVLGAEWSTDQARWTVEIEHTETGRRSTVSCAFLLGCTGYYRYDEGYTPRVRGCRALRRADRAPPALARGSRLLGQARGRDRQRGNGGDARPGDGR